ncbi:MAG: Uma2 family endonuclease [Candidatus Rokubacteria bacterium]|nr:Uma2 family endonuclease [Candidatus Rokubacteria bacterium]
MKQAPLTTRQWTRKEYDRLGELGIFDGEPLELIGGQLVVAEPKGTYHVTSLGLVVRALNAVLPTGWFLRIQDPIALDDDSEPEPDVAVVAGDFRDYLADHPQRPALVVEVSESSLGFDRRRKGSLYARGGVQDYWIVNLVDRVLEVYREPEADPSARYGWSYRSMERIAPDGSITPLAFPEARISVAALLP